jgi:ribosome-associated heat shock protein Hsp15
LPQPLHAAARNRYLSIMSADAAAVRLDRWLWAARVFRSRSLAAEACDGGKVTVNGNSAKPHKLVRPSDEIAITLPNGKRTLKLRDVAERRGPASVARLLYDDLTPPKPPEPKPDPGLYREIGTGRPTKRDRRQMDRLRMR